MTNKNFLEAMEIKFASAHNVMSKKIEDYNPEGVAFKEAIEEARRLWPNDTHQQAMLKYIWIFYMKHHKAMLKFVMDGHVESEPIQGRFTDALNFICIMAVMENYTTAMLYGHNDPGEGLPPGHPDANDGLGTTKTNDPLQGAHCIHNKWNCEFCKWIGGRSIV